MNFCRIPSVPRVLAALAAIPVPAAEVFELGVDNFDERPKGREADGIVGDFVIRNDKVEAVISGNLPLRRANMSTFTATTGSHRVASTT